MPRGVIRPTATPKPGSSHAASGQGGAVHGSAKPMTGTGGVKTHAHGMQGGLVQPGNNLSASRQPRVQSGKAAG